MFVSMSIHLCIRLQICSCTEVDHSYPRVGSGPVSILRICCLDPYDPLRPMRLSTRLSICLLLKRGVSFFSNSRESLGDSGCFGSSLSVGQGGSSNAGSRSLAPRATSLGLLPPYSTEDLGVSGDLMGVSGRALTLSTLACGAADEMRRGKRRSREGTFARDLRLEVAVGVVGASLSLDSAGCSCSKECFGVSGVDGENSDVGVREPSSSSIGVLGTEPEVDSVLWSPEDSLLWLSVSLSIEVDFL